MLEDIEKALKQEDTGGPSKIELDGMVAGVLPECFKAPTCMCGFPKPRGGIAVKLLLL